ncbi:unnamed protein product [Orchesella dallaii]|uniref:Partial AB-hydrolase lipase domain-containing protein n=1 Tax=Orchesella dallaii TaxID=48710 RepID=A0ABP1RN87_9HEXA
MSSKALLFSTSVLAVFFLGNATIRSSNPFRFPQRKCVPYKPTRFDITFSHRRQCLQSLKENKNKATSKWNMDTLEEIETRGYNVSTHTILSKDGYYSTMYRISGGLRSPPKRGKRAVLVFHGFASSAKSWIIQPGSRNIAFTLADAGYEVWLANIRGTTPSRNHSHFNADIDYEYWDFGSDQVGTFDLPLMINLMLQETGTDQIYYACHSAGCEVLYAGLVDVPELNNKIKASFLLAPAFIGTGYSPFFMLFPAFLGKPLEHFILNFFRARYIGEPIVLAKVLGLTADNICEWSFMRCGICDNLLFAIFGADPEQLDYNNLPNILKKMQDNSAMRILIHGKQSIEACDFRRYDYGRRKNMIKYGSADSPSFNLSRIAVPTYIFYGEGDNFFTPVDMARLKNAIPVKYLKGFHQVEWHKFNHIDFCMAKDADILVYHKIRGIMNEIEKKVGI